MDFVQAINLVKRMLPVDQQGPDLKDLSETLVSAFSTVIQVTSHAEQLAKSSPYLKKIRIGIYCALREDDEKDDSILLTLYGPEIERNPQGSTDISMQERVNLENRGLSLSQGPRRDRNTLDFSRIERTNLERGLNSESLPIRTGHDIPSSVKTRKDLTSPSFDIPPETVARCMSYLFDISGWTSHSRMYRDKSFECINARLVASTVRSVFKEHKSCLSENGINTHGVQYESLVPQQLREKTITLPKLRLHRNRKGGCFTSEGKIKTNMIIGKADRNKKEQNIAVLAALLYFGRHNIDVGTLLRDSAKRGLLSDGCKMFTKCRLSGAAKKCVEEKEKCNKFFNELNNERKVVAEGTVDPFSSYVLGQEILRKDILVNMSHVGNAAGLRTNIDEGVGQHIHGDFYTWPRNLIGRVKVLGEYREILGTANFAGKVFSTCNGTSIQERAENSERLSIREAVLLCDVCFREDKENEPYPFVEWYGNSCVRNLRECLEYTPKRMKDVNNQREKTMLWDGNRILAID